MMSADPPAPESIDATLKQGIQLFQDEDWPRALLAFDAVARLRPHRNDVHNYRARTYERLGRLEDALQCLDRALAIDPHDVADLRNRAILLRRLGRHAKALADYEAVLSLRPNDVNARIRRGLLLNQLERRAEALDCLDQVARAHPDDLDALNARVIVLDNLGRYDEALQAVDRMLAIRPAHLDAINNAAMLMARLGRFEDALRCCNRSLALDPNQAQARYNRSLVRLSLGDWSQGFEEFESRWKTESLQNARVPGLGPLWLGRESLAGKTLLLYHEQGYGDTLQIVRYIPLLADRGARVILLVPPALERLMRSVRGVTEVASSEPGECVHNYHCPLMSLPLAFGTTPDTVPTGVPYLHANRDDVARWEERLGPRTRPRIGLVWGGRRYAPINYPRDVPLESLRPLLDLDVDFVSLQKEMSEADRALLSQFPRLRPLGDELEDFAATAGLIENLDLVIAADTAVAHLAGALGKPVWLMNRYASCWRWLQSGPHSIWYPTMRQFRQPQVGDWDSVVAAIHTTISVNALTLRTTVSEAPPTVNTPLPAASTARREKIRFVCATRLSKQDFLAKAPLGRSLPLYREFPKHQIIELRLFAENRAGLSGLYNTAIEEARSDPAVLVFIHDDVYLSDYFWSEHLHRALQSFDLVGLVGNKRRLPGQVSWMYLDKHFTCDSYDNFSGVLGHGDPFPDLRQLSVYGEPGVQVKLLDGVFMASRSQTLLQNELRFDPRFQFDFYDMDFCRQAELRQLKIGTCAMSLVHASIGKLGSPGWASACREYLAKYGES